MMRAIPGQFSQAEPGIAGQQAPDGSNPSGGDTQLEAGMPKSTATANAIINLMYRAAAWANVADNAGSSPATNTYVSMHTASPGTGDDQTTNETAYTNYARQAVARSTGWDAASGGMTANAAQISFPQCGATGATLTHVAVGTGSSGTGHVWHQGALNSSLAVANGITPQFAAGALTVTES